MSSWRQQALIEAPVEEVWNVVGNPARYPEYAGKVVSVTGLPAEVERDARFRLAMKTPLGTNETTFVIETLDELREIKLRCTATGYFSRWLLTEAQESTFLDLEIGMDPTRLPDRAFDSTLGKRWYRRMADDAIDGLKRLLVTQPRGR